MPASGLCVIYFSLCTIHLIIFLFIIILQNTMGAVSLLTIHAEDNFDIGVNAEISYKIASSKQVHHFVDRDL